MDKNLTPRRKFLKIGGAVVAVIPLMAASNWSCAATNAPMRSALKYQATPDGDKDCAGCMHFVPGKDAKGPGECKILAGDTEISPQGYCTAWLKK